MRGRVCDDSGGIGRQHAHRGAGAVHDRSPVMSAFAIDPIGSMMAGTTEDGVGARATGRIGKPVRFRRGPATVKRPRASKPGDLPTPCDAAFVVRGMIAALEPALRDRDLEHGDPAISARVFSCSRRVSTSAEVQV